MKRNPSPNRLSKITTDWNEVQAAHRDGPGDEEIAAARNRILMRYASCVRSYILGATKNQEVAEELSQEFALRFVRGDYHRADPAKGRFRDYLKTSVRNLVTDYFRKKSADELTRTAAERIEDENSSDPFEGLEAEFQRNWRQQLLSHVWDSLEQFGVDRNNSFFVVLHYRAKNPTASSADLATSLSAMLSEPVTSEWVRQNLHRARQKFAELLIAEVRRSMNTINEEEIQQELVELGLQKYM